MDGVGIVFRPLHTPYLCTLARTTRWLQCSSPDAPYASLLLRLCEGTLVTFAPAVHTTEHSLGKDNGLSLLSYCVPVHQWLPQGAPVARRLVLEVLEPLAEEQRVLVVVRPNQAEGGLSC